MLSLHATYKNMGLEELEKWSGLDGNKLSRLFGQSPVGGYVILKTCNRIEVYMSTDEHARAKSVLTAFADSMGSGNIFFLEGINSVRHLMRVCAGLDSMVIGEQEVQRQVKEALLNAQECGSSDRTLNYVFMKALNAGKEVRQKTHISKGVVSIPHAALKVLNERGVVGRLNSVGIIGTGRVGTAMIRYLKDSDRKITISGRSKARLRTLSSRFGVDYAHIDDFDPGRFDCIITATSSNGSIHIGSGQKKPQLVIDLGNPRNVVMDSGSDYVDLDRLNVLVNKGIESRNGEVERAEQIICRKLNTISKQIQLQ